MYVIDEERVFYFREIFKLCVSGRYFDKEIVEKINVLGYWSKL